MDEQRRPVEHTLLSTTDAMVWAEEFCRIFNGFRIMGGRVPGPGGDPLPDNTIDEGAMVGWFANAIETGVNQGRRLSRG